jgi:hypothetical protein
MRGANPPLARRSGLQISKDHQKCASAPHFRPKDFSLQASVRANSAERNEIPRAEKAREGRGQIRMRWERPHPLTHRASRLLWGRSRLSHAQRVTHLAASQSRSFGVVRQRPVHPVMEKVRTWIKAPQYNPRRQPSEVHDEQGIEGVLDRQCVDGSVLSAKRFRCSRTAADSAMFSSARKAPYLWVDSDICCGIRYFRYSELCHGDDSS